MKRALLILTSLLAYASSYNISSSFQRLDDNFVLYWDFDNTTNVVTMGFLFRSYGWIGVGFGEGMNHVDMVTAEYDSSLKRYNVFDRWSRSTDSPPTDVSQGGTNDIIYVTTTTVNDSQMIIFNRTLKTNDTKYDTVLKQGVMGFGWAAGSSQTMSYHDIGYGSFTLNFTQGYQNNIAPVSPNVLKDIHSYALYILWGFLIDIPIIWVRHGKSNPNYILWHRAIMLFIGGISLICAGYFWAIRVTSYVFYESVAQLTHFIIGTIYMVLILYQLISGFINKCNLESETPASSMEFIKKSHKYVGYLIYLTAKTNVFVGAILYNSIMMTLLIVWYPIMLIAMAALDLFLKRMEKMLFNEMDLVNEPAKIKLSRDQKILLSRLQQHESVEEVSYALPNAKWALFGNRVLDLTNFNHPGGAYFIEHMIGREIGRFIFGAYGIEALSPDGKPHRHTINSLKMMADLYIGDINITQDNLIVKKASTRNVENERESIWKLTSSEQLSKDINRFNFTSTKYSVKGHVSGIRWFGRHFSITSADVETVKRQYTTVLCMFPANIKARKQLVKAFDNKIANKDAETEAVTVPATQSELCLFVKKYSNSGALSLFLHDATPNLNNINYIIEGPIGEGLGLYPNCGGIYHFFVGGTGILPILDFLDYLLHRTIHKVAKAQLIPDQAKFFNPRNENYEESFGPTFGVVLYGAFTSGMSFLGQDIVLKLAEYSEKWPSHLNFKAFLKVKSDAKYPSTITKINGRFDEKFVQKHVNPRGAKYIICGPPQFNYSLNQILADKGVAANRVSFL